MRVSESVNLFGKFFDRWPFEHQAKRRLYDEFLAQLENKSGRKDRMTTQIEETLINRNDGGRRRQ